ncbi:MAG: TolC family protein, partial [Gemmatimonadota bacterium]|nr:TolC family protein [Gemmatimonadota bacterium]
NLATLRIAALGMLLPAALAAQVERPGVRLEEAILMAERVQPSMVQARTGINNAMARQRVAKGAFLPSLSFSTSGNTSFSEGLSRVDQASGQVISGNTITTGFNGSISTGIDLFTGFRRGADRNAADAQYEAAEASLTNVTYQQKLTTTNQFYDVVAAEQLLGVRQASLVRAQEQFNVAVTRLRAGAGTTSDSLRSVVTMGQARLAVITTETQLASAEANLGRLIGREGRVRAIADSTLWTILPNIDTTGLRIEALNKAPSVQVANANLDAASASLKAAKSAYFPSLSLSASNSFNANGRNDYTIFQSRSLGLSLSWNIFNRFSREQSIQTQISSLENSEASQAEARRQVLASMTVRLAELFAARTRIEITTSSVAAANEDLRVSQERYRLGLATIVELLQSQEALNQADVDAVNARFDYLRAKAQIEALIGRPL